MRRLSVKERDTLSDHGVITLNQLAEAKGRNAGISKTRISRLLEEAEIILALQVT